MAAISTAAAAAAAVSAVKSHEVKRVIAGYTQERGNDTTSGALRRGGIFSCCEGCGAPLRFGVISCEYCKREAR